MKIEIPNLCLVVLVGASSSGKSTFAKKHFKATEIVNSDYCRAMVADDENAMDANTDTFDLLHYIVEKRLQRGLLTVVDATNVQVEARKMLVALAKKYHVFAFPIILNLPEKILQERNATRSNRQLGAHVIRSHRRQLRTAFRSLRKEGFPRFYELKSETEVDSTTIVRRKIWSDKRDLSGPFDIIGDVHGCLEELKDLLVKLGYGITRHRDRNRNFGYTVKAPTGRTAVFVGDLVDRGPASHEVLRLVMSMQQAGNALVVCGNHDDKLLRKLKGKDVQVKHGLEATLAQLEGETQEFLQELPRFLDGLISHYVLDEGRLVVAHAGLGADMQGRTSKVVRAFCLYGETTGEIDEFGLPVRYNWAQNYRGKAAVVYGHTPVLTAEWYNNTIDIDTGCVFGGQLTALRYPERELVSVPARKAYAKASRPMLPAQETNAGPAGELMPWSAKAKALLQNQYAAVGAAGHLALETSLDALARAQSRGIGTTELLDKMMGAQSRLTQFQGSYRQYCWEVESLEDYRLAPFHLLATEGQVHSDKNHLWHLEQLAGICASDPILQATNYRVVDLNDTDAIQEATDWWVTLTEKGGEGMVVKPLDFVSYDEKRPIQPALKCRGREYLRIIYGPDYTVPEQLAGLKKRGLSRKRSMAMRGFALGLEAMERFVRYDALRQVHECVFGILALESEPVDPRL